MPKQSAAWDEVLALVSEAETRLTQIRARATEALGDHPATPQLSRKEVVRVDSVGEVAFRHRRFIDEHGSMTLGDSLAIRRELYGASVRSTANLFGRSGSGALFYRTVPFGTPRKDDQEVKLTAEGERIAALWMDLHGESVEPAAVS